MKAYKIEELIPQRAPFILVDKLIEFDKQCFKSKFYLSPDHYFARDKVFAAEGLIENMAQTAAAGVGYEYRQAAKDIKIGYIGAIQKVAINELPLLLTTITTVVTRTNTVMNVEIVKCEVFNKNGRLIASSEMKVFINQ
ncbi:hypothetical protein [Maribellus mangrovi]|uniref:hypothetical protein n=1 Tax=Maribellus mangrovi TaxID=3133146 RepID=UPI0030EC679D